MLKNIPSNIKNYTKEQLNVLCDTLRTIIYDTVMQCGGHLSSNLGAIESTVALFHVFDFPKDKIIFDVGHQCYAYKLLSGRADRFLTLRTKGGISGFPKRTESEYDFYDTGHAGTSVSAALGYAKARDLCQEEHAVIAYVGDGSFNNGLIYEALNSLRILHTNVLIILNDNGMSISPTVGGMRDILEDLRNRERSENVRLLESFGLTYMGVVNGNDVEEMVDALQEAKEKLAKGSVLLHIATKKGYGYEFSEEHPTDTHGISPVGTVREREYSDILGETLCEVAKNDPKIAVVSAAMKESLGLKSFFEKYAERAFDVGICEENASVLCASMAAGGLKPYYAIYSTFLQRAFDEIIHDVCAQDLPVTFCIDRAGISGADGETHQGVFDLSYLSIVPNLTVLAPKDTEEFRKMLQFSATYAHPLAIRYPRSGKWLFPSAGLTQSGRWEYLHKAFPCHDADVIVLAAGERCLTLAMQILQSLLADGKEIDVISARSIKPLDEEFLMHTTASHIVTIEDNVLLGGFGSMVALELLKRDNAPILKNFAYKDAFIPQGTVADLQREYGVDVKEIEAYIREALR